MNPNDHGQRPGERWRIVEIKSDVSAADALINYISLDRSIGNLRRPTPSHNRLRDLATQHGRGDRDSKPCMPPSHHAKHSMF